jgi:hypothetical protein
MITDKKFWLFLFFSNAIGLLICWIDSRPTWDDTGVTAAMILIASGAISYVYPKRPFIWAIAVSIWIPIFGIVCNSNYGTLMALVFGFIGAHLGFYISKKNSKD